MWAHLATLARASLVVLHQRLYAQQQSTVGVLGRGDSTAIDLRNERDEYTDKLAMLECLIERSD